MSFLEMDTSVPRYAPISEMVLPTGWWRCSCGYHNRPASNNCRNCTNVRNDTVGRIQVRRERRTPISSNPNNRRATPRMARNQSLISLLSNGIVSSYFGEIQEQNQNDQNRVANRETVEENEEDERQCVVCRSNSVNAAIVHNGNDNEILSAHYSCCVDCAAILCERGDGCPICRRSIESVIRIFES